MPLKPRSQSRAALKQQAVRKKRLRARDREEDRQDIEFLRQHEHEPTIPWEVVKAEIEAANQPRVRRRYRR